MALSGPASHGDGDGSALAIRDALLGTERGLHEQLVSVSNDTLMSGVVQELATREQQRGTVMVADLAICIYKQLEAWVARLLTEQHVARLAIHQRRIARTRYVGNGAE